MPQRPRKTIQRRGEGGLSGPELENLLDGRNLLDGDDPFPSEAARQACWILNRDFILSLQGKPAQGESFALAPGRVYFEYGCRPHAWWSYESAEPRRLLTGDPDGALPEHGLQFGIPAMHVSLAARRSMIYESQRQYLERLELLADEERKFLQTQDNGGNHAGSNCE